MVNREAGPVQIERKNMERITRVNAEIEIPLSEAVEAVQARLGQMRVPPDFSVGFGSEVEEQARSFQQLQLVLILAVLLVYAVMASQYESLRDPFIIMFSVPVAAIGVVAEPAADRTRRSACRPTSASSCWPASSSATPSCWWTTSTRCAAATACRCARRSSSAAAPVCGRF